MTDEEKAEKYAHDKMSFCEDYDFNYKTAELYIKQGVLYGLAEGRKDRNCVNCSNHSSNLRKENAELKAELERLNARNKKQVNEPYYPSVIDEWR